MGNGHDIISAFLDALSAHGISIDRDQARADGAWHRAHVEGDRRGSQNLSYRIFDDSNPAGYFEDHKRGITGTFALARDRQAETPEQAAARIAEWRAKLAEREREQREEYARAAVDAIKFLAAAGADGRDPRAHPYIVRKQIEPGPKIRATHGGLLLVPVYQSAGVVCGYQWITPDGSKFFQDRAEFAGAYHPIPGPDKRRVIVCEGYATGAAIAADTGHPVACAMSAGNLAAVVAKMRAAFPGAAVWVAADNDVDTERRTGINPGIAAARKAGADRYLAPAFGSDEPGSDWDDYRRIHGPGSIARSFEQAELVLAPPSAAPESTAAEPTDSVTAPDAQEPAQAAEALPSVAELIDWPALADRRRIQADLTPDPDTACPAKYSELNASKEFARQLGDEFRYVDLWGRWLHWTGRRWEHDQTRIAIERCKSLCAAISEHARHDHAEFTSSNAKNAVIARYGERRTISAVADLAKSDSRIAATAGQFDADLWLLNTPGGAVDLRTGELRPAERTDYCTKITRTTPAATADCPRWLEFLDTATAGDAELIEFLRRVTGYALTGDTREQILVFVYGPGGNGKGTFLNTIQWIMGDYATTASMDVFTERKHDGHPTEIAGLMGARLVTAQETEEGRRWAEQRIKALTGGDVIKARYMRQDEFEFLPQCQIVIAGNHKPILRNVDEAMRRRMRLIPFDQIIPPAKRDNALMKKLRAEAPAILRWAIDGCLAWQRDGLRAPPRVMAATDDYFEQQDTLGEWISECCDTGGSWLRADLYQSFRRWAERTGEFALPQKRFVAALESRGIRTRTVSGRQMCDGLQLRHDTTGGWPN